MTGVPSTVVSAANVAASGGVVTTSATVTSSSSVVAPSEDQFFWSDRMVDASGFVPGAALSALVLGTGLLFGVV